MLLLLLYLVIIWKHLFRNKEPDFQFYTAMLLQILVKMIYTTASTEDTLNVIYSLKVLHKNKWKC